MLIKRATGWVAPAVVGSIPKLGQMLFVCLQHVIEHCLNFVCLGPSGWTSSASYAALRSPCTAASTVNNSYAFTAAIKPNCDCGNGSVGMGVMPLFFTVDGISNTQSEGHSLTAPLFFVFTTWVSPKSL